jgi:integrating conjugative element protein (TIGR03749 family)
MKSLQSPGTSRHRRIIAHATLAGSLLAGLLASSEATAQQVQDLNLSGVPPDLISPNAPASGALAGMGNGANLAAQPLQQTPVIQTPLVQQNQQIGQTQIGATGGNSAGAATGNAAVKPASAPIVNLGQNIGQPNALEADAASAPGAAAADAVQAPPGIAERAAQAAQTARGKARLRRADLGDAPAGPTERVTFERAPVRVPLPIGRERMVTLPAAAALHVPSDMDRVAAIQNIDRTLYITANKPFAPIRVIAELVDTGQRIPLDLFASKSTAASAGELEVSVIDPHDSDGAGSAPEPAAMQGAAVSFGSGTQTAGLDMVQLTRYAAHQLYAPARLAYRLPGVTQIQVAQTPQPALIRGVLADIVPLGAWKSGPLYVTAVRISNRSRYPLEIPLEQLRGRWIAATAQHGRVGPTGSDTATTAIYLISDRPFEACL